MKILLLKKPKSVSHILCDSNFLNFALLTNSIVTIDCKKNEILTKAFEKIDLVVDS